jgi:predicted dehydrogenase
VVALQFGDSGAKNDVAGGVAATLTVSAFTEENTRTIHLMGTHGEIHGHLGRGEIVLNDFTTGQRLVVPVNGSDDAHGGGDEGIVRDFLARLRGQRTGPAGSDLSASVESHLMAFAAERSRLEGRTVELASLV